jgi:serine/threonine protein kinase
MQALPNIPGYVLVKPLGGGPLTQVYVAHDLADGSACAVKLLRQEQHDPSIALKLLQREARAGLTVRHPHLVRLRDAHVTRPPYFLVMDLLPGESLRRRLGRDQRLDMANALWIGRQVAEALAALHRTGFLHGDVKPDNVRLVNDGTAVLIDLGFAHRPGENAAFLQQGYVLGTADYLAPELCGPDIDDSFPADWFSFGVTLYEMIAGRLPYPVGTVEQTFRRHSFDPPVDIRRFVAPLPAGLRSLIDRLLARRPADRPRAAVIVQQLVALEIAAFGQRRSA